MGKSKTEQFTSIPHSLMCNKELTDQDKLTLGLILSFIKNDKECYMGNEYIAGMMGITKNAASIRIKRLEKLGCISLRYSYKEGKMEVDKRFITLLSLTPKVSSDGQEVSSHKRDVSSDRQRGIVSQTKGYRPADEEVSSKPGGIKQDLLNNVLENVLDKFKNTSLRHKEDILNTANAKFETELFNIIESKVEGYPLTLKQKNIFNERKEYIFKTLPILEEYIN
jgi:DNA-binding MarR family transcriptional regulator